MLQWEVFVETCFNQKTCTRLSGVTSTTNVRDLKLLCEVEFAIPAELQVLVHEKMELDNTITIVSLPSQDANAKTFKLHIITELQSLASSCMKGDIQSVAKGIQDKTNHLLNTEERAFVAAFIAAGSGKDELLKSLLEAKEWFVDITTRTRLSRRSLLHAAVAGGDLSCVANIMFMNRGSLDVLYFEDEEHESALDLARRLGKPELAELLEKCGKVSSNEKSVSAEESEQKKTNLEVICLESTSLNELDLTSENKNAKQKDQVSGWITEAGQCDIQEKQSQNTVCKEDSTQGRLVKQDSGLNGKDVELNYMGSHKLNEALEQRNLMECSTLPEIKQSKTEQSEESPTRKTQKEKRTSLQQTKTRFRKPSLKLLIPLRNKNKSLQERTSPQQQQQSTAKSDASVEKMRANSADKHTPKSASPSGGTVPKIKIIKNLEDSARDHHVKSHIHAAECARLSPTTENLITTQRPFSAHSHGTRSPTTPRRLISSVHPRSSTIEKERHSSHLPPRSSPPAAAFCIPHPPNSPSSSRRQSWSPSPDLVAKLSPILQRKFGSACDLERPRSGSLKLIYPSNSIPSERQIPACATIATLPLVDCKRFEVLRQDLPVQSLSAPTSPQSPRKLLPLKINQELEELHHRFVSTRSRTQSFDHRRGSLPGNLDDNNDKDENWKENFFNRQKHGIPFEVWLREKEEQSVRKCEFELAAIKTVEKLADQTWSEIRSQGKTYEQWLKEKDHMKSQKECRNECIDHATYGECSKKALKYEEWLRKKDEEDLRMEEEMRREAERQFEEIRRKREIESERKIAKLIKHDK